VFGSPLNRFTRKKQKITDAAFENGYTDHFHFLNTFKKFMAGKPLKNFLNKQRQSVVSYKIEHIFTQLSTFTVVDLPQKEKR